LNKLNKPKNI